MCKGEHISIAMQHYLEAEIQRRRVTDPIAPADFLDILLSARTDMGREIPSDRDYLERIAQVAYERHAARRVAQDVPTLIVVPKPLTRRQAVGAYYNTPLLGYRMNYVVVFGAESIYFQDTVHALAVDSRGMSISAHDHLSGVNVLGAHMDWISPDGRSIERALVMDETGLVKEVAFNAPVPIHTVQILHLPLKGERQLHKELSRSFRDKGITQINPYEGGSQRADDKAWTHALWDQYGQGIVSPEYVLILQHISSEEIVERLRSFIENTRKPDLVVQPNKGTEGYKVKRFQIGADFKSALPSIVEYIEDCILTKDDAIVRERRGNVRYRKILSNSPLIKGDTGGCSTLPERDFEDVSHVFLNVAFRINVAWSGSDFVAESGYAQVAGDERIFPASRGRGGTIVDINEAFANLYYPRDGKWIRFIPTDEDIEAMKAAAISAAYGLNMGLDVEDYLKHMGIDILLEVEETDEHTVNVIPVVLEANSRPAGLAYSSEIIGISGKTPQPRISKALFRFAASKRSKQVSEKAPNF